MQAATMSEVEFYCEVFSFVSSSITEKLQLSASCDANLWKGSSLIEVGFNQAVVFLNFVVG
jgi:hypothetical protein